MQARGRGFLEDKFDEHLMSGEDNRYVLSLLPYEETTTYQKGTRLGPEAIVEASGHIELFDETLHIDASRHGIETLRPAITDLGSITEHVSGLAASRDGALLGFLGGEHSITPAIVAGLAQRNLGVVWLDAHADLRRVYRGREDNHACAGYNTLPFGPMVQVGVRSLAEEEVRLLAREDRVRSFQDWGDSVKDAIRALPETVYLSVDLDGFSPTLIRAVGTPEPGGLMWEEGLEILDFVFREKRVCAFDVVELCPVEADIVSSFTAARLVYKVLAYHAYHRFGR